jgi:hypothetical protein
MPAYNYLLPADRFALTHYVRSFVPNPPEDTRDDLIALETTYQLSMGASTPGSIPVRKAKQILVNEKGVALSRLARAGDLFEQGRENRGALVLSRLPTDDRRALYCLVVERRPARSLDEFVETLCVDPQSLGLRPEVVQLTSVEWSALYQFVRQLQAQLAQEDRRRG